MEFDQGLPDSIGKLTGLRVLSLSYNRLAQLPATIVQLEKLRILRLNGNSLTSLPEGIVNLKELVFTRGDEQYGNLQIMNNSLCDLSEKVAAWAETFCPGWRNSQRCSQ